MKYLVKIYIIGFFCFIDVNKGFECKLKNTRKEFIKSEFQKPKLEIE